MKVSDYIVAFLADRGITDVFGYPGGMVTHLMDSFARDGRVAAHVAYHEQGAAFCACGYAQVTRRPGVAYATSGPGATNLLTGIANAYFDSIPCLFITGQVNTYESLGGLSARQRGFQETDIVSIAAPVTKAAAQVADPADIRYTLERLFHLASAGRPGPVLLDLPMDIQRREIEPGELRGYVPDTLPAASPAELETVLAAIDAAQRPCLLAGAGVRGAGMAGPFRALAGRLGVPVVTSMPAVDLLPHDSPLRCGFIGAYGDRRANFILAKSDLVVSMGSRLDVRQTGAAKEAFAPRARLIRFEVDRGELTNVIKPGEQAVTAPLEEAIPWLLRHAAGDMQRFAGWRAVCDALSARLAGLDIHAPNRLVAALSRLVPDGAVVTTDVGQNQVWAAQSFACKPEQRLLFSAGHGAMGYSLPAAIGAYYGSRRPVVSISGDGGFQMNMQELQFIRREGLPVKIVILNNRALGMIRHFQEMYFDSRYAQTVGDGGYAAPPFDKLAAAYGLPYALVREETDLPADWFMREGPSVMEAALEGDTYVFPKLAVNMPNQDQEPPLDRALYEDLMAL